VEARAFYSKSLNDIERNYDVHDKEMMGYQNTGKLETPPRRGKTQSGDMSDPRICKFYVSKKLNHRQREGHLPSRCEFEMLPKPGSAWRKASCSVQEARS